MERWTGKEVAAAINQETAEMVKRLSESGTVPKLALFRLGENPSDLSYEKGLIRRADSLGIRVCQEIRSADVSGPVLSDALEGASRDPSVHGILIFRPLPKTLNEERILQHIAPEKDLDGVTEGSLAGVFSGSGKGFAPCTAEAVIRILDYHGYDCTGKRAVVIGRSTVIGKPAAMLLLAKHATVTIAHTRTRNLPDVVREADLVIAAAGHAGVVGRDMLREGQIVIDVGINVDEEGRLCGDVNPEGLDDISGAFTPVPGGVGSVTTAVLMNHAARAAAALSMPEHAG